MLVNGGRVQLAVLLLPEPVSATAVQPTMATPLSVKLTVPVGVMPVTVAVNVPTWPPTKLLTATDGALFAPITIAPVATAAAMLKLWSTSAAAA